MRRQTSRSSKGSPPAHCYHIHRSLRYRDPWHSTSLGGAPARGGRISARRRERYQRSTGLRSFALYEGDVLTIAPDSRIEYSRGSEEPPDLLEFEKAHFSPTANTRHHFPAIGDLSCLDELAHRAASHMFAKMNRLGLSSEWVLALAVSDGGWEPWYVDLAQRQCTRKRPADRPMLTCRSESNYLVALLTGNTHWNNAMISFNLRWHRFPDVYDRPLFDAMNFFHVPRDS